MLYFASDYLEGCHPLILKRLEETNFEHLPGYGFDKYSDQAKEKIRIACGTKDADVFLLSGGTQSNETVISGMLKSYEGVISADTGHIFVHEAGATEYTGHKILPVKGVEGKITAQTLKAYLEAFYANPDHDHMCFPGMVYISHPTEYGTIYSKSELKELHEICLSYQIPLFVDGARLGYALTAKSNDISLQELATLCDVFYIGGTKCGALSGEAVVFPNHNAPLHFFTIIKEHGALLAKGRLLGIQFDTLFTDHLYERICLEANQLADELKKALIQKGYHLLYGCPTNQIFCVLSNDLIESLKKDVYFSIWEPYSKNETLVRFCISWATKRDDVLALIALL